MENVICGYIELNGELVKISSVEELKTLANRLGSAFTELTKEDYENLCEEMHGEYKTDDCGVLYSKDGRKVLFAPVFSEEYIIKAGAIAIAKYAFNWHSFRDTNSTVCFNDKYIIEKKIKNLLIPDSVIAVGSEAFGDNTEMTNVIVSQNLEYIGPRAFRGCWRMNDFRLPSSTKYIGTEAFAGCINAFKELIIPASVKYIGSHAFRGCARLEKVIFASSVGTIGSGLFESCEKLSEIVVPKDYVGLFRERMPFYSGIITETSEVE